MKHDPIVNKTAKKVVKGLIGICDNKHVCTVHTNCCNSHDIVEHHPKPEGAKYCKYFTNLVNVAVAAIAEYRKPNVEQISTVILCIGQALNEKDIKQAKRLIVTARETILLWPEVAPSTNIEINADTALETLLLRAIKYVTYYYENNNLWDIQYTLAFLDAWTARTTVEPIEPLAA